MNYSEQLGEEKISKLLISFSVPAVVAMLVNASYNIVDRIFIGRGVGSLGIAGITVTFPFMLLMMAFGMLIGLGTTALISLKMGEERYKEAERILGNGFVLLLAVYFIIGVLGLSFMKPILEILGASEDILPYASQYMSVILYGAIFQGISFGMNNFIRAEGSPRHAMFTILIAAVCNIILDPIFIFVFGMGIKGAALATIISQGLSAFWVLHYFFGGKSVLKIRRENLRLQRRLVKLIVTIGSAPCAMQIAASIINIILNNSLSYYGGDLAISAMGIVYSITMVNLMPIFGINQGAQPIIGYNYGAKKFTRVKKALGLAVLTATVIVTLGFIATRVFPTEIISLFNKEDGELISLGTYALNIYLIFLPIIGFQVVCANYYQAVGKPKQAMILSLSRQVLIFIPALLILPKYFGLKGVFMAGPVSDLFASLLTAFCIYKEMQQLNEKERKIGNIQPQWVEN